MDKLNEERVTQDDPRLVQLIRNYYIEQPSEEPYKLLDPERRDPSLDQAVFVDRTLRNMASGFFVDSGAHDGEIQSNTLFFERIRHWTGILIEPQPKLYQQLKSKHRKSFHLNACVSFKGKITYLRIYVMLLNLEKKSVFVKKSKVNDPVTSRLDMQCQIYISPKRNVYKNLPYNVNKDPKLGYEKEMDKLNKERVKPDDPRLVHLIRNYYIEPPSQEPYKLGEPGRRDQSYGQSVFVDGTLRNMESGFFVDSGAHDGEIQSNTLFFERIRHWTGILIEPQPEIYKQLKRKHRKSFLLNACVSVVPYPSKVKFLPTSFYGKMVENVTSEDKWIKEGFKEITVQCFPLYSILLAMNQLTVDYFSLDVEGLEVGILNNIPHDKVKIRTISIEYDKVDGGAEKLKTLMKEKGYKFLVKMDSPGAFDCIFYK
ncbi:uncharacterized protein LOC123554315 [Mercenaria mercenaria]|uniref:uncharacterized protein LOC123554315 n=1 Tax=Mercenaria mercenaria TaxID=6596 RepID=UPI00234E7C3D|nr:uncharacterized protein LOC123554315 [Mercenaria mercenaria]